LGEKINVFMNKAETFPSGKNVSTILLQFDQSFWTLDLLIDKVA